MRSSFAAFLSFSSAALVAATPVPAVPLLEVTVQQPLQAGNENFASTRRIDSRLLSSASSLERRDQVSFASEPPISTSSFTTPSGVTYLTVFGPDAKTYTLDKSGGSFGVFDGLVPVTVLDVDGSSTCDSIERAFKLFAATDDVWTNELFMQGLILNTAESDFFPVGIASCFDSYNASFIAHKRAVVSPSFASASTVASFFAEENKIPQGPYMARLSTSGNRVELSKVYRVYHDEQQAFTAPAVPSRSGNFFYQLSADVPGMNTLSIPVPSRVYSLNATTPERPLEGVRVGVKDIYDLAGFKTGCGNRAHWNLYEAPETSAYSVQKLIDAGAVIVGKTKTSQFANGAAVSAGWFDQMAPYNPRGDGYQSPSTSSSGSAAGLAAYPWLDITIGSDTGGSVRFPAGACGIYGLRPSWGSLSLEGVMPMASTLDTPGYFARNAELFARFGKAWFANSAVATRSYEAFPSRIRASSDLFSVEGPANEILQTFVSNLSSFLNATVDTTSYYGQWNETIGQEVGQDLLTYANASWTVFVGYYQYNNFGQQFIADYGAVHEGRMPLKDASVDVRWAYGVEQGIEGYNAAQAVKENVKRFSTTYLTPNSSTTCSESLFIYPQSAGTTSYRTYFPSYPTPAFGFAPTYQAIYADEPEITIPIGQVPYNSTVTNKQEFLPVTVSMHAARGCDFMLYDLAEQLATAGLISPVKTGSLAF
ncbi:hypothetical protein JCM8547_005870 [Rhodosporidiobolus lusitaniae]